MSAGDFLFIQTEHVVFAAIIGATAGSFLSVVAFRYDYGLRGLYEPKISVCPKCKTPLKWFNKIPVLSYLFQRGRCSNCGAKISAIYLALEILCALAAVFSLAQYELSVDAIASFLALCSIVAIAAMRLIVSKQTPLYKVGSYRVLMGLVAICIAFLLFRF